MNDHIKQEIFRLMQASVPARPDCQREESPPSDFALLLAYLENSHRLALAAYQAQAAMERAT